ncbi:hypothetical protein LFM09_32875 [Lentzea alba]|uniref:hypothetical protein n=1 Tax=Lentzea alba TaxID=2714351 RepID=UPI0039BF73BB
MAAPVRNWLREITGISPGEEVDSGVGVADFIAGNACREDVARRLAKCQPVTDSLHLALLQRAEKPVCESALREWAPWGWRGLRTRAVEPLLANGLLHLDQDGHYVASRQPCDVFRSIIAIELKLRDWRRGLAQASRYRLFSEQSYLALPSSRVSEMVLASAVKHRVGVLSLEDSGSVAIAMDAPAASPLQPARRHMVAEKLLEAQIAAPSKIAGSTLR